MHVTIEELDSYAASLPQPKVLRTFEAKLSLAGKTKLICKTSNVNTFIQSVQTFQSNFPKIKLMISMMEIENGHSHH